MKLYHLADLHLGKTIYGTSMLEDQRDWIDKFLALCRKEQPDAVVAAGDIYDRSAPSGEAVVLLDHMLTELADQQIPVLLIAGNHDSGQRLSFGHSLFSKQNIHIAGTVRRELEHVVFQDPDGNGPVVIWMLPYVFPEQVSLLLEDDTIHTYEDAVRTLISLQDIDPAVRNVIISHQNVTADGKEAQRGGSETMVGGLGQIDYSVYALFDYVALGHIHSAYPVGRAQVRYAGTPLCYHFAETRQKDKGVTEVILPAKGENLQIRQIPIEPLHRMRLYEGTKEEVYAQLLKETGRNEYVGITLTDQRITPEISAYISGLLETRECLKMELVSSYSAFSGSASAADREKVQEMPLEDLFASFYEEMRGGTPPDEAEYELLQYIGELTCHADLSEPVSQKDLQRILDHAGKIGGDRS